MSIQGGAASPLLRTALEERNEELSFLHHASRVINMRGDPGTTFEIRLPLDA